MDCQYCDFGIFCGDLESVGYNSICGNKDSEYYGNGVTFYDNCREDLWDEIAKKRKKGIELSSSLNIINKIKEDTLSKNKLSAFLKRFNIDLLNEELFSHLVSRGYFWDSSTNEWKLSNQ